MTNSSNLTLALLIVLSINIFLFLGQYSTLQLNPMADNVYDVKGSLICSFEDSNCQNTTYTLDDSDPTTRLAPNDPSVTETTGNIFVDVFSNIKSWFLDSTGLNFLINLLSAPKSFLVTIGMPDVFAFAISALWYGLTLFLILAFWWGR